MNDKYRCIPLLLLILSLCANPDFLVGATLRADRSQQPLPQVNLRIYAYARISSAPLSSARKVAVRILRQSGIQADWVECIVSGADSARDPRCRAKTEAIDIVVRVLPQGKNAFKDLGEIGVAFLPADGGFGQQAAVFYCRIEDYAIRWQASEGMLLGHVIAHEVGHLLLGEDSHSASGVMSAPWTRNTLERAALGNLFFTAQEGKRMRGQVAQRMLPSND